MASSITVILIARPVTLATARSNRSNLHVMKHEIRHRRLYAFFYSKVLNALMIVIIIGLLFTDYNDTFIIPVICSTMALLLFLGYALWLWIKKPQKVVINQWLSNISGWFILYFLCVIAIKNPNQWWYIIPGAGAVVLLFLSIIKPDTDETFIISENSSEPLNQA